MQRSVVVVERNLGFPFASVPMKKSADSWYVRFPDGRTFRATSTQDVRDRLESGRIPISSVVRRHSNEEWSTLEWTREFADLVKDLNQRRQAAVAIKPSTGGSSPEFSLVSSRMDPDQMRMVGVRGAIEELLAALDSSLIRKKLLMALLVGFGLGLMRALHGLGWLAGEVQGVATILTWGMATGVALLAAFAVGIITEWTYIEVSHLRPSRWREGFRGSGARTVRILCGQFLVVGTMVLIVRSLFLLAVWLLGQSQEFLVAVESGTVIVLALVLQVALWPLSVLVLLLPPIFVVERVSFLAGFRQWIALLRKHGGRAFVYEALALGIGIVLTLPFLLPLLSFLVAPVDPRIDAAVLATLQIMIGLAVGPLILYLSVANVFIYLNLRYEVGER